MVRCHQSFCEVENVYYTWMMGFLIMFFVVRTVSLTLLAQTDKTEDGN